MCIITAHNIPIANITAVTVVRKGAIFNNAGSTYKNFLVLLWKLYYLNST